MQRQQVLDLQAAYDAKYPGHCTHCAGQGWLAWVENMSPLGSGEYWPMDQSEACEWCLGDGRCPRCGQQHTAEWVDANLEHPAADGTWPHPCDWCGFTGVEEGRPLLEWCCDDEW